MCADDAASALASREGLLAAASSIYHQLCQFDLRMHVGSAGKKSQTEAVYCLAKWPLGRHQLWHHLSPVEAGAAVAPIRYFTGARLWIVLRSKPKARCAFLSRASLSFVMIGQVEVEQRAELHGRLSTRYINSRLRTSDIKNKPLVPREVNTSNACPFLQFAMYIPE